MKGGRYVGWKEEIKPEKDAKEVEGEIGEIQERREIYKRGRSEELRERKGCIGSGRRNTRNTERGISISEDGARK